MSYNNSFASELVSSLVSRLKAHSSRTSVSLVYRRLGTAVQAGNARRIIEAHSSGATRGVQSSCATGKDSWQYGVVCLRRGTSPARVGCVTDTTTWRGVGKSWLRAPRFTQRGCAIDNRDALR